MGSAAVATSRSLTPRAAGGGRCRIRSALGLHEPCRREECPLWESGGAVVEAGCVVERLRLDVEGDAHLAWALRHVLRQFDAAESREERDGAYALFERLVPTVRGEGDDGDGGDDAHVLDS